MTTGLSLTETICIKDTRQVTRDNTVKYHWRVMQLPPRRGFNCGDVIARQQQNHTFPQISPKTRKNQ